MLFEEGFEIGLSFGSPIVDLDPAFVDFEKVKGATPQGESDDSLAIVRSSFFRPSAARPRIGS